MSITGTADSSTTNMGMLKAEFNKHHRKLQGPVKSRKSKSTSLSDEREAPNVRNPKEWKNYAETLLVNDPELLPNAACAKFHDEFSPTIDQKKKFKTLFSNLKSLKQSKRKNNMKRRSRNDKTADFFIKCQ